MKSKVSNSFVIFLVIISLLGQGLLWASNLDQLSPVSQLPLISNEWAVALAKNAILDLLRIPNEDTRFEVLERILGDEVSIDVVKQRLTVLLAKATYKGRKSKGIVSNRKRIDLLAKALSVGLRRKDASQIADFLRWALAVNKKALLLDVRLLIKSHLDLLDINQPFKVTTVMGVYEGQTTLSTSAECPVGEDAVRRKIRQHEDYYGLRPDIDWQIIYVVNGDDRYVADPYAQEKTSTRIIKILREEYPEYLAAGKIKVYEIDHALREAIGSVHGGCTIYGMRKAVEDAADIIIHNNIDLDCHTALTGSMIRPILSGEAGVVVGSNRVPGGKIRDYNRVRLIYSKLFNLYARALTPIGPLLDPQNAFKAFSREAVEAILPFSTDQAFDKYFDYHFTFANQLLSRAVQLGFGVIEVPSLKHWSAELATPKPQDTWYMVSGIWRQMGFHRIWRRNQEGNIPQRVQLRTEEVNLPDGRIFVRIKEENPLFDPNTIAERFGGSEAAVKVNLRTLLTFPHSLYHY